MILNQTFQLSIDDMDNFEEKKIMKKRTFAKAVATIDTVG